MMRRVIIPALLAAFLAFSSPVAGAEDDIRHSHITLIPEKAAIAPGETITLAVRQEMEEGWHTYWINPGDSGEMMRMHWTLPAGFATGEPDWPVPHKIMTGPLASYGYENEAVILVRLTAPADLPDGPVDIMLRTVTLVCADICIPETQHNTIRLNAPGSTPDSDADPDLIAAARTKMPAIVTAVGTYGEADGQFILTPPGGSISPGAQVLLIPYEWGIIDNAADAIVAADGTVRQARGDRPLRAAGFTQFLLAQADGAAIVFTAAPDASVIAAPAPPAASGGTYTPPGIVLPDISFLMALLLAFAGGMILNLMPCVFPVLFMKALSLCQLPDSAEREARVQALLYTAGILASFAAVAGALMALRAGGAQIGWGFQLQNPVVVMILAYLFFIIGLNLAGFFEISGRFAGAGQNLIAKGGKHSHAFFMGVLATIVATPCTAPFMGAAMGFALVQQPAAGMAVFLALGLGLAFPYVLISFVPALRRMMPRPGAWMEMLRRLLAIPMFLTVAWLAWVFGTQTESLLVVAGLVLIVAGLGVIRLARGGPIVTAAGLVLLAAALALAFITPRPDAAAVPAAERSVQAYSAEKLDALLAAGQPVFVNMTADWCITCKVNERVALSGGAQDLMAAHGITYLVGDWTRQDPAITAFLARYGRNGVPLYVFYGPPDTATGKRPDPVVLPQILTPGIIARTIQGGDE